MAENKLIKKLNDKLINTPSTESDVVYILSRIRKILESDNYPEKYSCINFYCNLALHSKIDRLPETTKEMFLRVKDGGLNPEAYQNSIIGFEDLHKQLIIFIKEYNLPDTIYTKKYGVKEFNRLLTEIYSDTPIVLNIEQKIEVTIDSDGGILFKYINTSSFG